MESVRSNFLEKLDEKLNDIKEIVKKKTATKEW